MDGIAFPVLTAAMALAGYRVTNRMGHHRVAVDAVRQLVDEEALMSRIGALRRMRDRGMYEMEQPDVAEVTEALDDWSSYPIARGRDSLDVGQAG